MPTNTEHDDYVDSDDDGNDDCNAAILPSPYHIPQKSRNTSADHIQLLEERMYMLLCNDLLTY